MIDYKNHSLGREKFHSDVCVFCRKEQYAWVQLLVCKWSYIVLSAQFKILIYIYTSRCTRTEELAWVYRLKQIAV